MLLKRILATVMVAILVTGTALSQQPVGGSLTITSEPAGAEILLEGETVVTGVTPTVFQFPLIGKYRLTVKRHSYETYRTELLLDPRKEMVVNVRLVAKTRIKAAVRSLLIPGWGQYYSGQKAKGLLFTFLTAASAAGFFIADNDFNDKLDRYNSRLTAFDRAERSGASFDKLQGLLDNVNVAQNDAYQAENVRRLSIGSVAGVWSLSVLDALLFFPEDRGAVTVKGIAIEPIYGLDYVGINLSRRF